MNDLDELFRQELDGHATEPGADLWARLQARTAPAPPADAADPLDAQFRAGLVGHATPPRRELWERLEDEHLRPRPKRRAVVAWGRLAIAASLLLLVLAGGTGWWLSRQGQPRGPLATASARRVPAAGQVSQSRRAAAGAAAASAIAGVKITAFPLANQAANSTPTSPLTTAKTTSSTYTEKNKKNFQPWATATGPSPSSSPVARTTRPRRPATAQPAGRLPQPTLSPDAAGGALAHQGARPTPTSQAAANPGPALVAASTPASAELGVIEVEVRRGNQAPVAVAAVAAAPAPAEGSAKPRLRLGGLLRQASHALRGEAVSLAEATGLPETVTVQARLGGHTVSKTLQL